MACQGVDVIAAGVTVVSAVGRRRRTMAFSGVASQYKERGAMPAGTNFEIAATIAGRDVRSAEAVLVTGQLLIQLLYPQLNSLPSVQMQCRMTASLQAKATVVFLRPMRLTSLVAQFFSGEVRRTI